MGLVAKVLSFARTTRAGAALSETQCDGGGGAHRTAHHYTTAGVDSHPLAGDYVALIGVPSSGRAVAVGYADPKNKNKAQAGDIRHYARSADGAEIVELWLHNDGTVDIKNGKCSLALGADGAITTKNGAGNFGLDAAGVFTANGVKITPAGAMTVPGNVSAAGLVVSGAIAGASVAAGAITSTGAVGGLTVTAGGKDVTQHVHNVQIGTQTIVTSTAI